jgi:dienelactone hydrolase
MKVFFVFLLALQLCGGVWAQDEKPSAAAPEVLAKDLREELLRTEATVKDMYGRQETKPLPMTVYRPPGDGPFPLVVFNHGRAVQARRASQGRYRPEVAARYLVAKGFVVLVPNRIGYGETYGAFDPENSGCRSIEPMSIAASDQVLAAVEFAKTLPYVDTSRWVVAGQSVGGLTSVATVGRAPAGLLGGINFSGGTGGNPDNNPGRPCNPGATAQYWGQIAKDAKVPMLWLYWENDKYWGAENPKNWHKAWVDGGGIAEFNGFAAVGEDGHSGLNISMDQWLPVVEAFLGQLGFDRPAIVKAPPPSAFAAIEATFSVPVGTSGKAAYAKFLEMALPRAFAVSSKGGFGVARGDYAVGRALGNCQRYGNPCTLYAVDSDVVWKPQ